MVRGGCRRAAWLGLWLLAGTPAAAQFPVLSDTLAVGPDASVVCLSRSFVLRSTLSVVENGRPWEPGVDYSADTDAGCLTLFVPDTLRAGRTLIATYQAMPLTLQGGLRLLEDPHRRRTGQAADAESPAAAPVAYAPATASEGLTFSGSKTFGIEVGNRSDLKLRQSLDLRLTGQVTEEVSLLAILSDQDVPFQPEGNTAELAELDRVLVQIRAPRASASLGDVNLTTSGLRFLEVNRELEGFAGDAGVGPVAGRGAVASAKGEFATLEFFGADGKQGPYFLSNATEGVNIAIVAGSERVYLDGAQLERGSESDYVIDYGRGEITFTSRRVITANSKITVDYQFVTGRYRRRITYAGARSSEPGPWGRIQAGYFVEGDDPDAAVGGELSDEERAQLAALGDSALIQGGTRFVGDGRRDYDLVVDAETGREIFVFVEGTGDFEVAFLQVGEGKGGYEPDPLLSSTRTAYRFVGEGEGSWTPSRDLPAPVRHQVLSAAWGGEGTRGAWSIEGAMSDRDGNTLSALDDQDNQGGALLLNGRVTPIPLGGGFRVAPRIEARRVGEAFRSPNRFREGFYTRDWNLVGTEAVRDEFLVQGGFDADWKERLRWSTQVGRMALADSFVAVRQRQDVRWTDRWFDSALSWNSTRSEVNAVRGDLDQKQGDVLLRRWSIQPRLRGSWETRRRATGDGERHRGWEVGLLFPLEFWPVGLEAGVGRAFDDSLQTGHDDAPWRLARDAKTAFVRAEGRWRDLSVNLRYEARRVADRSGGPERRDSSRLDLRHQAARGAWSALLTTDFGTVGLRRRTKTIVAVPAGTGFFDQFGNYVGAGGDYDVEYGPPAEEVLTGLAVISTRLRWSPPGPDVPVAGWLRAFAWEGYVNINEASRLPLVTPGVFLDPSSYLNPGTTVDGRLNQRQILDLFPRAQTGLRLRQERIQSLTENPQANTAQALVETRSTDAYAATLRSAPGPGWDAELEGAVTFREEGVGVGTTSNFSRNTRIQDATARGGRRLGVWGGRGRSSLEVTHSRETGADARATGWIVRPRLQWSLSGRGRLDLRYSVSWLTENQGFTGIRGPGAPNLQEGTRLDVLGELRLHRSVVLTSALALIDNLGTSRVVEGRMEVRGSF